MDRILILGSGGAGKSTLSRELGTILDLPVIHLDRLFWHAGWIDTPREEWAKTIEEKIAGPKWIMDGNYGGTMEMRLAACDTAIFLNFSRWICLRRVLGRSFQYRSRGRPDMAEGCPENMDIEYLKFLKWIWTYPKEKAPAILRRLEDVRSTKRVIILQSPHEVKVFLEVLKASTTRRS
jgi:adenylate kinase family enzyme